MSEIITDESEYKRLAQLFHCQAGYKRHVIAECGVCGAGRWVSSSSEGAMEIEIVEGSLECLACAAIRMRAPEIYEWVLGVVQRAVKESK